MKLVYRGIKYSSNNSTALKIVEKHQDKVSRFIDSKKLYKAIISYNFPLYKYLKQLLSCNPNFVRNPRTFKHKYLTKYLGSCWQKSEIQILDSCWKLTLEKEQKAIASRSPQKLKYRGVTYYK